ncbi:MAG: aminotransferase class IV [Bacteroidota bacterium]
MSRLIETIRFAEGRAQNLQYHLGRMDDSSQAIFGDTLHWKPKYVLRDLVLPADVVYKVRIVYDLNSHTLTHEPYTIRPVRSLKLVTNNDIVYDHKFENRNAFEQLLKSKEDCDEILIVKNGMITDTSYSNIIFKKDDRWFTPGTFLLNGTMRQYLLDNKKISAAPITIDNIRNFSHFKLINAMLRDEAAESHISNIH